MRPSVEGLERRLALSTLSWTGKDAVLSAAKAGWSDAANWKDVATGRAAIPRRGDDLVFGASAFNPSIQPVDDIASLQLDGIEVDAGYTIIGAVPLAIGSGGLKVSASDNVSFQLPDVSLHVGGIVASGSPLGLGVNKLSLVAATVPINVPAGSVVNFLQGGELAGTGDLVAIGGGFLNFLSQQTSSYAGTVVTARGKINGGMSGGLLIPKKPKLNTAQVLPGGNLSVGGGASGAIVAGPPIVFGVVTPLGNVEVDGGGPSPGEVDVYPGDVLNATSLSGTGIFNPSINAGGGPGGVINVGPTLDGGTAVGPVVDVVAGGTIAPGSPGVAGSLTIQGAVNFAPSSTLAIGFGGPGSLAVDALVVQGYPVDLGGATLSATLPSPPPVGVPLTIVQAPSIRGRFANLPDGGRLAVGDIPFVIHYVADSSSNVTSVTLARLKSATTPPAAFDGSDLTDLAVYLPNFGEFAYQPATGGAGQLVPFGIPGFGRTVPAAADYAGIGSSQVAAYLPDLGVYAVRSPGVGDRYYPLGVPGPGQTIPVPADYEGTGRQDVAIYLPGYGAFAILPADGSPGKTIPFGARGAGQSIPAPADYYNTGRADIAVYLAGPGAFAIQDPTGQTGGRYVPFGLPGVGRSLPVPGDYDGSGRVELAVYVPSLGAFFYRSPLSGTDVMVPIGTANSGQLPAPGDYDGSGHAEVAIYDPARGFFEYLPGNGGPPVFLYFGAANGGSIPAATPPGDLPIFAGPGAGSGGAAIRPGASTASPPAPSGGAAAATVGRSPAVLARPTLASTRMARLPVNQGDEDSREILD